MAAVAPDTTTSDIDVSIVVPCYNVERWVEQALDSVRQNDRARVEFILVNDGSTDGTLEILRRYPGIDERFRVIDKPNAGYGAGVNRGFSEACGRYVGILEPDDYVLPHMYDAMYELAQGWGWPDVVKSSHWRVLGAGTADERREHALSWHRLHPARQPFVIEECPRLLQYHPSIWSALYRRDWLVDRGIRFREVPGAGWVDNPFLFETLCQASSIVYTDDAWYCYREEAPGSSSATCDVALSLERWNDMADVVERLGIADQGVLRALYTVGYEYVREAIDRGALKDGNAELVLGVLRRMRPDVVDRMPYLPLEFKRTYAELTGNHGLHFSKFPHYRAMAEDLVAGVRHHGPAELIRRMGVRHG